MYTLYTAHFKSSSVTGLHYTKFIINIEPGKCIELDYFLSFTEFKNILINAVCYMDTCDIIKYGQDIYIFTLYNIFLSNNTIDLEKSTINSNKITNKSLTIYRNYPLHYLGLYYPSRNGMNKRIVKISFDV